MKLPDVNIWLALTLSKHSHHIVAAAWLQGEEQHLCFCRTTQQGLVRLLTTAEVLARYGSPPGIQLSQVVDGYLPRRLRPHFRVPDGHHRQGVQAVQRPENPNSTSVSEWGHILTIDEEQLSAIRVRL